MWAVAWSLLTFQTTCLTLYQYYNFFAHLEVDPDEGYRPVFMNSFSVLWYTYGTMHNILMYNSREAIRNYINCLFRSNRELVGKLCSVLQLNNCFETVDELNTFSVLGISIP